MVFITKTAGFVLSFFALAARYAWAVDNCDDLASAVSAIATEGTIAIEGDFSCASEIVIFASHTVTITGEYTISIGAGFSTEASSLFVNDGSLTLQGLTFESEVSEGNRAVWNTGTLTVDSCSFKSLQGNGLQTSFLDFGGAVREMLECSDRCAS